MPSFWEWLCMSRQRYTTQKPAEPRHSQKGERHSPGSHHDAMFEVQSERSWNKSMDSDWSRFSGKRNNDEEDSYTGNMKRQYGDSYTKNVKRYNSQEKKNLGARHSALSDSYERGPQLMSANYRLLYSDQPRSKEPLQKANSEGLPLGSPSEFGLRSNSGGSSDIAPRSTAEADPSSSRKRRHVQDIFMEASPRYTQERERNSPNTSAASLQSYTSQLSTKQRNRKSAPVNESRINSRSDARTNGRKTESMYRYTPRSVNDDAISAALFGGRIDDYNPDPAWNRAIDKFASSPTSSSSQPPNFSRQERPSSENFTSKGSRLPALSDSDVTYSSISRDGDRSRDAYASRDVSASRGASVSQERASYKPQDNKSFMIVGNSNKTDLPFFAFSSSKSEGDIGLDIASLSMRSDDAHDRQASPGGTGSDLDIEKVFSCDGDVLY